MILTTIALVAQAAPSATASPAAAATPDIAKVTDLAKAWYAAFSHGEILDEAQLTDDMKRFLTPHELAYFAGRLHADAHDPPIRFDLKRSYSQFNSDFYDFFVTTYSGKLHSVTIAIDKPSGQFSYFDVKF